MSIDELGRAAAADLRRRATDGTDASAMFGRLRRMKRRRTARPVVAVVAACTAVVGIALTTTGSPGHPSPSPETAIRPQPCAGGLIKCLGGNKFRIGLDVPVTVTVPRNFGDQFAIFGTSVLEEYRTDVSTTGVTVMEKATPVKYDASWSRDPSAGRTAASVAQWLAHRPFLTHATVDRVRVGGVAAWRVTGDFQPGAARPASEFNGKVAPTFRSGPPTAGLYPGTAGYRRNLSGQYTLLDVPGAGLTVIWSWSRNHGDRELRRNQPFVDGLSFG